MLAGVCDRIGGRRRFARGKGGGGGGGGKLALPSNRPQEKLLWLLPLVILMAGCSQQDQAKFETDTQKIAQDTGAAAESLTLAGKVEGVLRVMKKIDKSDVHVEAKDGVVTLTGKAVDDSQKQFILDTANGVKGVDKVVDHMVGCEVATGGFAYRRILVLQRRSGIDKVRGGGEQKEKAPGR